MRTVCAAGSVLLLVGCSNTTDIQRRYVDYRDECRNVAEQWVQKAQTQAQTQRQQPTPQNLPPQARQFQQKDVNAQLATVFSDCMFKSGWTVATPPRERSPGDAEAIEARQRTEASRVLHSDGVGIGPSLEPGKNLPNFRRLKYR